MTQAERLELFSTPVVVCELPQLADLNARLAQIFSDESKTVPGMQRSNVGGWHSAPDLAKRDHSDVRTMMAAMVDAVHRALGELAASRGAPDIPVDLQVHGWAMVMEDGAYSVPHDHADAHWSWVYYLDAGDADGERYPDSGALSFIDPRGTAIENVKVPAATTFSVPAATGRLVLFPGFLRHYVHPYRGTRPRVSVACNARVAALPRG